MSGAGAARASAWRRQRAPLPARTSTGCARCHFCDSAVPAGACGLGRACAQAAMRAAQRGDRPARQCHCSINRPPEVPHERLDGKKKFLAAAFVSPLKAGEDIAAARQRAARRLRLHRRQVSHACYGALQHV